MRELIDRLESRYAWSSLVVDGHAWRWLDTAGTGPAVVLLPGSVGDGAMFVRTLLSLGQRLRLIAVTYPAEADPVKLADGLKSVMDHLHLPPCVVVGSSFAAYWAQFVALRHPSAVRKLVIGNGFVDAADLASNPLFDPDWVARVAPADLHGTWLGRVQQAPVAPLQQLQLQMLAERQSPDNLHARFAGVTQAQACPPLPLRDDDIVVLDCDDDPIIPAIARDRLRNQYPRARHARLATGGHYPHVLNPQRYEGLLLDVAFA
ncbi:MULTISPECIES: alpha/beta fold hydrolase [Ramlibacter]|uniref:Maspardin n=1 Tax=Ramlibacter pinisoli TaxID=2682844 RepID=A0A6N8IPB6_9BURK|nr:MULTISPECIES: alpha/beta hydrolase [Ramlibacter]MBA2963678.1 alpha/beta hydrolase [Ramlibacter sp. CGMCC 1.13660]MVQ28644.1 alpha/beta fold hydrolase [Ramlibacter pinisoli]